MNANNKPIKGVENVALAVARVTGGHFFDPDTRRFFEARVHAACEAPDGLIYVLHSTANSDLGIARRWRVTVFYREPGVDYGQVEHLGEDMGSIKARKLYLSVAGMGCVG